MRFNKASKPSHSAALIRRSDATEGRVCNEDRDQKKLEFAGNNQCVSQLVLDVVIG